jgi:isopenicillin-N N-acyltransferase like protein
MNLWPKRMRRWGKWLAGLVAAGLVVYGMLLALVWHWVAVPPAMPHPPEITKLAVETRGDRVYLGKNWFGRQDGLPLLYLTGSPFDLGYANGALTQEYIRRQEDTMLALLRRVAPYRWMQFLLKAMVVYKNRHLPEFVATDWQMEIYGLSQGCPDVHPEIGPYYHRLLNYHAAQDISYMLMNSPLIRGGCTAFGAWGPVTRDGHLLVGRNFDWEAAPVFDEDRLVVICEPDRGIPFISLAWAGMVGCVSGLNREGICVTVNGAPSQLPSEAATPTCLVAREVLQYAHHLDEAQQIIQRSRVFVSALFLVGSRRDGTFVVIEKTPAHTVVRQPAGRGVIICANHYLTPDLKDDPMNLKFLATDTSRPRYERMQELLDSAVGKLDVPASIAILRDRRLAGGEFAGNGHRASLNPLIATHAVVMDLTTGIFWAAAPPHQLGRFVPFDLTRPGQTPAEPYVDVDPMLVTGEYREYIQARAGLEEGWRLLKANQPEAALERARTAEKANPGFYQNAWLSAEAWARLGRVEEATRACQSALKGQPALASERRKLEALRQRLARSSADPESAQP